MNEEQTAQTGYEQLIINVIRYAVKDEVYALIRMRNDMDVMEFINSPLFMLYGSYVSYIDYQTLITKFWEGVAAATLRQLRKNQEHYQENVTHLLELIQDEKGKSIFIRIAGRANA